MSVSTSSKKLNKGKYYLSTGYKPSQIGFIPVDWHVKKIADISEDIFAGATPSTSISEYWNGDIPWMSSGEINKKIIWETEKYITEKGFNSSSTKMVPENSVLIALAGQGRTRGTVAINKIKLCTNQSIASIIPNDMVDYKFLYYNLDNRYNELRRLSAGDGGRGGLNLQIIKNIYVGLPPKSEQQKIADILSTWDKAIQLKEKLIEQKKEQKKGLMQRLLTGKVRLPGFEGEWESKLMKDCINILNGFPFKSKFFNEYGEGMPLIRVRDIKAKVLKTYYSGEYSDEYIIKKGDVIIGMDGEFNITMWDKAEGLLNQRVMKIIPKKGYDLYFIYQLLIPLLKKIEASTPSTTVKHLSNKDVYELKVKMPSSAEQQAIGKVLLKADMEISFHESELEFLKQQKKGLMQLLLTGKVRVKC